MRKYWVTSCLSLALMLMATLASPVVAEIVGIYTEGHYEFHYSGNGHSFPPDGPYFGDFWAEGEDFDASNTFGAGQDTACGGFFDKNTSMNKTTLTLYAAYINDDDTVDAAVLWVTYDGTGIPTDSYNIVLGSSDNSFIYLDDIDDFETPVDMTDVDAWLAWASTASAQHSLIATSGTITFTDSTEENPSGTFEGTMADPTDLLFQTVTISSAVFDYGSYIVPTVQSSFGHVKALYR